MEDQDHGRPPKRIVEDLFRMRKRDYDAIIDGAAILETVSYQQVAAGCPQCFRPFVEFLEALTTDGVNAG